MERYDAYTFEQENGQPFIYEGDAETYQRLMDDYDYDEPVIDDSVPICDDCGGVLSSVGVDRCHCADDASYGDL